MRKVLSLLIPVGLGLVIASQWPDLKRYLKIKQMSQEEIIERMDEVQAAMAASGGSN